MTAACCGWHLLEDAPHHCTYCGRWWDPEARKQSDQSRASSIEPVEQTNVEVEVELRAALRAALRKALGALRDVSRATGGGLEPLIAECEAALDLPITRGRQ